MGEYDFHLDLSPLALGSVMTTANMKLVYNAPWMGGRQSNVKGDAVTIATPPLGAPGNPDKCIRFFYPAGFAGVDTGGTETDYYINSLPIPTSLIYNVEWDEYFEPGFDINSTTVGGSTRMGKHGCSIRANGSQQVDVQAVQFSITQATIVLT